MGVVQLAAWSMFWITKFLLQCPMTDSTVLLHYAQIQSRMKKPARSALLPKQRITSRFTSKLLSAKLTITKRQVGPNRTLTAPLVRAPTPALAPPGLVSKATLDLLILIVKTTTVCPVTATNMSHVTLTAAACTAADMMIMRATITIMVTRMSTRIQYRLSHWKANA